jgi:multicomponent Na+:H+ antiporter subunit G
MEPGIDMALEIISWVCLIGGAIFCLIGAIGIIRLPDIYCRMHGGGIIDTLGIGLIFIGLLLQVPDWITGAKLGLILVFIFFTSPTTTYALARAAIYGGVEPLQEKDLKNGKTEGVDPSNS